MKTRSYLGRDLPVPGIKIKEPFVYSVAKFLCLAVLVTVFSLSCKGKETSQEHKQATVENPYSAETIFADTKHKVEAHPEDPEAWYHLAD
ncbi:MAG: hypothetical protein HQL08_13625, partial [Nitrospirae bacterium]|nr:hypothetical protein [Nitrospirota bacterium]